MDAYYRTTMKVVSIDEMLTYVGEFGPFQWLLDVICCLFIISSSFQPMLMYFGALNPPWKYVDNSSICQLNVTFSSDDSRRCDMPRGDWTYTEPLEYSIVTQFDIYCSREWIIRLSTSVVFIGYGIGAVILGWVADNYGRRTVLLPSHFFLLLFGFISSFLPNVFIIVLLRFFIGFVTPGNNIQSTILMSEFVGSRHRPHAVQIMSLGFPIATCIMSLTAYNIREWKLLFILCTAPYFVVVIFYKFIPESIRWLRLQGKLENVTTILHAIARWNKKTIPEDITISSADNESLETSASPIDLFRSRKLAIQSLVQGYAWFAASLVYFGLYFAANDLGGSIYRDFAILSVVDIPAYFLVIDFCERFGRKNTVVLSMVAAGAGSMAIAFIPLHDKLKIIRIILGTTGKFLITISNMGLHQWSLEIYPTKFRAIGFGFVEVVSRFGGAAAPWIQKGLGTLYNGAPFILMGVVAITAGLMALILPETKGRSTAECVEDIYTTNDTSSSVNSPTFEM